MIRINLIASLLVCISSTIFAQGISGPSQVCAGEYENFSYSGTLGFYETLRWSATNGQFEDLCGGTCTTASIKFSTAGQVKVVVTNFNTGTFTTYTKNVSIKNPVTTSNVNSDVRCGPGEIQLSVSNPVGTYQWYTTYTGGSPLTTNLGAGIVITGTGGSILTVNNLTSTKTYYVKEQTCNGSRVPVTATINPIPASPYPNSNARCGAGAVALSANVGTNGHNIRWYSSSTATTHFREATSYTTPSIPSTTTYYVTTINTSTGCESGRVPIVATINAIPSLPSANSNSRCGSGTVVLSGSPGSNGNTLRWYAGASGGSILKESTSYTTPWIPSTTTYYISSYNTSTQCEGSRRSITATINTVPSTPSPSSNARCGSGIVTLSATVGANGNRVRWYTAASGGSYFWENTTYSPNLPSTTTYYISSYNSSSLCESGRVAITGTINPIPSLPTASNQVRCGAGNVTLTASVGTNGNTTRWYSSASGGSVLNATTSYTVYVPATTTYYVSSYNTSTGCESTSRRAVTVTIDVASVGGTVNGSVEAFGVASGTLTLTGKTGNVLNWLKSTDGNNWTPVSNTTTSLNYTNIGVTTYYKAVVKNGTCGSAESSTGSVTIYDIPTLTLNGPDKIAPGSQTALVTDEGFNSYEWYRNGSQIIGESGHTLIITKPGDYHVTVLGNGQGVYYTTGNYVIGSTIDQQTTDINYITTIEYGVENVASIDALYDLNSDDYILKTDYFDGLGRPLQSNFLGAGPDGSDLVTPMSYDEFGRMTIEYLPFSNANRSGAFDLDAITNQAAFYSNANPNDLVARDDAPFKEKIIETSPLGRVLEQGSFGEAWQLGMASVTMTYEYNSTDDHVITWKVNNQNNLVHDGEYDAYKLYKTEVVDEENHIIREFKNSLGQVILKRVQAINSPNLTEYIIGQWADTYYAYDDYGNLRFVLPPEAINEIGSSTSVSQDLLDRWAFQYRYDGRRRMVMKKVPGADSVLMVYDKRDRLVLTQDGNQRDNGKNEWLFTKYDELNRPILTGKIDKGAMTVSSIRAEVAGWGSYYEQSGSTVHGYTNNSYPQVSNENDYLTVTYYDDYTFPHASSQPFVAELGNASSNAAVKGQITGIKVKSLDGTNTWLKGTSYYDNKYRVIQSINETLLGEDRVSNSYDFVGKLLSTKTTHENAGEVKKVARQFVYDHAGRLVNTYHKIGEKIEWVGLQGLTETAEGDLIHTGTESYLNSGAYSASGVNVDENAAFEVTVQQLSRVLIGLNDNPVNKSYSDMDYAIYLPVNSKVFIYENGARVVSADNLVVHTIGDYFSIMKVGSTIHYQKNGKTFFTSLKPVISDLYPDVTSYYAGDIITGGTLYLEGAMLSSNEYNELGELIEKNVHSEDEGTTFAQSIDYRYNIRGWMTNINEATLTDGEDDYFGMELGYNNVIAGVTADLALNGNISAVKWSQGYGAANTTMGYGYSYDPMNRIIKAQSYQAGAPNAFNLDFIDYDLNGNIQHLTRKDKLGLNLDTLTYNYIFGGKKSNRLMSVKEEVPDTVGFIDGNTSGDDYEYDPNGNMTSDLNKGISRIAYNYLNLPDSVIKGDGQYIKYIYDASGIKLAQEVYAANNDLIKRTDYVGEFIYENDTLQLIQHEEGRIVPDDINGWEYQYHLRDHLGNTRVTFTTKPNTVEFNLFYENQDFVSVNGETVMNDTYMLSPLDYQNVILNNVFDHTDTHPSSTYQYAYVLNGNDSSRAGSVVQFDVGVGDTINTSVMVKLFNITTNNVVDPVAIGGILTGIISSGSAPVGDGVSSSINNGYSSTGGLFGAGGFDYDDTQPMVFLNMLFIPAEGFDTVTDAHFKYVQVTNANNVWEELTLPEFVTQQSGTVIIYVSNESGTQLEAYFDDMHVVVKEHPVIQKDDYMPFGGTFNSWQRVTAKENDFKYQGKELVDDLDLEAYDFETRVYDQLTGRTWQIDPGAEMYYSTSPYSWVAGNPIKFIDPTGAFFDDYYINNDGSVEVVDTGTETHNFYVQHSDGDVGQTTGDYTLTATLTENSDGMVQFPASGNSFLRYGTSDAGGTASVEEGGPEVVGSGDHFVTPETAAALYGVVNEANKNGLIPSFGDMSSSNGSDPWQASYVKRDKAGNVTFTGHHAGHGHNGTRSGLDVDFRYFNTTGAAFQNSTATTSNQFSLTNNQSFYDTAKKFGFTRNYQGTNGSNISGASRVGGHNDHGHIGRGSNTLNILEIKYKPIPGPFNY
ncbi:DUF6443 domain-containing protein [Fulvivirga sp.]|uniref:Ig-like domain-containing protein n=1 Tax=Fulvivirga sp. TaxID=1931237 RepID=UPI0032EBC851